MFYSYKTRSPDAAFFHQLHEAVFLEFLKTRGLKRQESEQRGDLPGPQLKFAKGTGDVGDMLHMCNVGMSQCHKPPIKLMVNIPPTKVVMNGGWCVKLLYQHEYIWYHQKVQGWWNQLEAIRKE